MYLKIWAFVLFLSLGIPFSLGHPLLADSPANSHWHIPAKSSTATFLGSDQKETAVLLLKKSPVLGTVLTINSDATQIVLQSGDSPKLSFPVPRDADGTTTTFKLEGGEQPALFVNDKEQPRLAGKAIQVALAKDETLTLSLENAGFATVKFEMPAGGDAPADSIAPTHPLSTDSSAGGDVVARVKKSVFQIQVLNIKQQPFAGGTGFIVSEDGFAVTNFHNIQGGAGAIAIVDDKGTQLPLELWSIDPPHDLALMRLPKPKAGVKYEVLSIEDGEPGEGANVWSVGSTNKGYIVTNGSVTAVQDFQSFPAPLQQSLKSLATSSRWIQTDFPLNQDNAGGPLVDAQGRVVGVSSWIWLDDKDLNYALSAKDLAPLLRAEGKPALTFAGGSETFLNVRTPWSDLPRASVSRELLEPCSPDQLLNASDIFDSGLHKKCTRCGGTGEVTVKVQDGVNHNGDFDVPRYRTETRKCDRCKGTGIDRASDDALTRMAAMFLKRLSGVSQSDPKTQDAVSKCYQMVTDCMIGDYKTWAMFTGSSRSVFSQRTIIPGTAVIAKVEVTEALPVENGQRRFMARVVGTEQMVYVVDPVMADALVPGTRIVHATETVVTEAGRRSRKTTIVSGEVHHHTEFALMGGIIDGPGMLTDDKQIVSVVKDGFLIAPPIHHEWWWWWRDRE